MVNILERAPKLKMGGGRNPPDESGV